MVLTQSCSDDELLTGGGPDGFAVFYRRHVEAILRYHARWARDAEVAADLTAETFAAALESKHRFSPGGPPARAWLFGIAVKKLADYRRRGYAEDRARRRLGMEASSPLRRTCAGSSPWPTTWRSPSSSTNCRRTSARRWRPGCSMSASTRT